MSLRPSSQENRPEPLLATAFAAAARGRLHPAPPLAAVATDPTLPAALRPAAVLIAIVDRPEGATVLLTERTTTLRAHSGQVAFPGGRLDGPHENALACALREAQEEVGLDPALVEPIGYLDLVPTHTGFRITPVVALVRPAFDLVPNPHEVAAVFECPLALLMDPSAYRIEQRILSGRSRTVYAILYETHRIWGITAGIVRNLHDTVYGR